MEKRPRKRRSDLNIRAVRKVKSLREKGVSIRDIAKIMDSDVKQVFRWGNYEIPSKTV